MADRKPLFVSLLALLACASGVPAASLETVLVTGSRLNDAVSQPDTVIDRVGIDRINPPSTTSLLRTIPNIIVSENGGASGQTFLSIRGGEPNFTLVLVDGVAVNDPTNSRGGGFDFNQLDPATIERVEVYRGGLSAIYGGEAISGVIQFITRSSAPAGISLATGNENQQLTSINIPLDLARSLSGVVIASNNESKRSDVSQYQNDQVLAKLVYETDSSVSSLVASSSWQDLRSYPEDSGGELSALGQAERNSSRQDMAAFRSNIQQGDATDWTGAISYTRHRNDSDSPGIASGELDGIPPSEIDSKYEELNTEIFAKTRLSGQASLLLGGNYRSSEGKNEGTLDFGVPVAAGFSRNQNTWSLFAETTMPAGAFKFDIGLRYDSPNGFDSETSTRLAANYAVGPELRLYANYSEGYKLPSFFALSHPLIGNPDLKPERSRTTAVGVEYKLSAASTLNAAGFYNEFEDLVDFDPEQFVSINRNSVVSKGIELNALFQSDGPLSAGLDITYLSTNILDSHAELRRRPEWSGGAHLQALFDRTDMRLSLRSRGSSRDSSLPTGPVSLSGYTSLDLAVNYYLKPNWTLTFSGENLLDEDIEEAVGFVDTGPLWRVGFRYQI